MSNLLYNYYTNIEILTQINDTYNLSEDFLRIPLWTSYINIINILLLSLFILMLGLALPQKPKYIKFLHFIAALYVIIILFISSLESIGYYHFDFNNFNEPKFNTYSSTVLNTYDTINFNWYPNLTPYSNLFFIIASIAVICLLLGVSDKFYSVENNKMEFLLLVIFIYIGAVFLLNSIDFISILILLECIAFSSYILVGFERQNKFSSSSGIKYLILGSIPGGLFVLGITLLYKNYGSFFLCNLENLLIIADNNNFINDCSQTINQSSNDVIFYDKILNNDSNFTESTNDLSIIIDSLYYKSIFLSTYVAIILIFINLLFKLTAAPVHMWAPNIYGGSPLSTATFLSIFSKLTIISFSIYAFINIFYLFDDIISTLLIFCGMLSIFCGIMGAFSEKLIKRFFVYSSMGHVGFMLLGIAASNIGYRGALDYLIIYVASSYIMWFILMYLTKKTTHLTNLKALSVNHPILSFIFSITLFSLSGLPPLAGFFVKFEIFYSLLNTGNYYLVLLLFLLTVFSFFYYLRIIKILYFENSTLFIKNKNEDLLKLRVIAILFHLILFFVIFVPEPIIYIIENVVIWLLQFKN